MTTPTLSFDPKARKPLSPRRAFWNAAFFRGELRRDWPKTLCYGLLLFLILPLPLLFEINSRSVWRDFQLTYHLNSMIVSNIWLYALCACGIAVFAGILTTRYLNRRTSADYYHSLPLRREGLILTRYLCGIIHFAVALCANLLLCLVLIVSMAEYLDPISLPLGDLFAAAEYMLVVYLFFYSLTVFCGMLCGTSNMQLIVTGLSLFSWPLFRALMLAFLDIATSVLDVGYYLDHGWEYTSPAIRLIFFSMVDRWDNGLGHSMTFLEQGFAPWEIALWLIAAVVLFLATVAVYRIRHVERAGTPVVFAPVATAVKWVVVVLSTMAFGWIFSEIGGEGLWTFFGFLLGGFLSTLLINTILTKNPKQMFDGWRVMLIYLLAFCLLALGAFFAVNKLEAYIPHNADQLTLYIDGNDYCVDGYTDPAVIAAWSELMATRSGRELVAVDKVIDENLYYFSAQEVVLQSVAKLGPFTIAYHASCYARADAEALLRAVANSEEFESGWDTIMSAVVDQMDEAHGEVEIPYDSLLALLYQSEEGKEAYVSEAAKEMCARLVAQMPEDIDYDFFQAPAYCELRMYDLSIWQNNYYYFASMMNMNTPAVLEEVVGMTADEAYAVMAEQVALRGGLYVAKHEAACVTLDGDGVMHVTDPAQIESVLRSINALDIRAYTEGSLFTAVDESYGIIFAMQDHNMINRYFIKGQVPSFVRTTLG